MSKIDDALPSVIFKGQGIMNEFRYRCAVTIFDRSHAENQYGFTAAITASTAAFPSALYSATK